MNVAAEIAQRKNIIAEAAKMKRALKRQRKAVSSEIRGWDETAEKASEELEKLEAGDIDGFQQTISSAMGDA
jgi:hypothetical protein